MTGPLALDAAPTGTSTAVRAWEQPASRRRIAVFRALQLGDMLCAVPALRALRAGEPDALITLIGLPWVRGFADRFDDLIDDVLVFPGMPGMPEQPFDADSAPAFYAAARERAFDLAIQLHGSGTLSNEVVRRLGARRIAAFCPTPGTADAPGGSREVSGPETLVPWPDGHEIERLMAMMRALGYPAVDTHLSFPLCPADHTAWGLLARQHGLEPGGYVCVHPGARMLSRRWPVERYAEVVRHVRQRWPVVITGAVDELMLAHRLAELSGPPVINLCGRTSLGTMAALVAHSRLLLCNDTGASHIAAAMDTPSVVVSCGSDAARWAPLDARRHRVLADYPPCRPCSWQQCPIGHGCAIHIAVSSVIRAVDELSAYEPEQKYDHV